jgi:adenylyltransferase/sulfurtransferase
MTYNEDCSPPVGKVSINLEGLYALIDCSEVAIIDVRDHHETPVIDGFADRRIPLSVLEDHLDELEADALVFVCQTGHKSEEAVLLAKKWNPRQNAYYLEGGMLGYYAYKTGTQFE